MEEQFDGKLGREISLKVLWQIFLKRLWILVIAAVVAILGSLTIIKATYVPLYEARSIMVMGVMGPKEGSTEPGDKQKEWDTGKLSVAFHFIGSNQFVVTSDRVLKKVKAQLPYIESEGSLKKSIKVEDPIKDNGIFLEIIVRNKDPKRAQEIANMVCDESVEVIKNDIGYTATNVYDYASLPEEPCNITGFMTYLLIGIIAAALVYIFFLLLFIFDDRIKSDDEIREYFGLSVLGDIPNASDLARKGGYYGKYRRYTKYVPSASADKNASVSEDKPKEKTADVSSRPLKDSAPTAHDKRHEKAQKPDGDAKNSAPKAHDKHHEKAQKPDGDDKNSALKAHGKHHEMAQKSDDTDSKSASKVRGKRREKMSKPAGNGDKHPVKAHEKQHGNIQKADDKHNRPDGGLKENAKPADDSLNKVDEKDVAANVGKDGEKI